VLIFLPTGQYSVPAVVDIAHGVFDKKYNVLLVEDNPEKLFTISFCRIVAVDPIATVFAHTPIKSTLSANDAFVFTQSRL
jgi:hypothetical protein